MKKLLSIAILFCGLLLSGCFESAPKCNDEIAVSLVKEILLEDKWFLVENGLTKETLMAMAMDNFTFEKIDMAMGLGFVDSFKDIIDVRDYSHKATRISLVDFMTTEVSKQSKSSYCSATLEIEYPKMPQEMRQKFIKGMLKGPIFDGGKVTREMAYSTRYTDDKKKIYVELLDR
ncbi:hypothetical protein [Helicobacter rodentium]|uniref:hypothetical protein n=1 Tax=Helicobacter rodentium TaxID=59617 RepID=UPI00047DCC30|nr:hypothetical protein [Helicobacter rodentium]